jgi:hypothetical protein
MSVSKRDPKRQRKLDRERGRRRAPRGGANAASREFVTPVGDGRPADALREARERLSAQMQAAYPGQHVATLDAPADGPPRLVRTVVAAARTEERLHAAVRAAGLSEDAARRLFFERIPDPDEPAFVPFDLPDLYAAAAEPAPPV